jgi:hypothetical protein
MFETYHHGLRKNIKRESAPYLRHANSLIQIWKKRLPFLAKKKRLFSIGVGITLGFFKNLTAVSILK